MATLITLVDGTVPVAADFNSNFTALNTELRPAGTGGTGQSTYTTGDILYASAANTLSKLAAGSTNQVLTMVAGVPAWAGGPGGAGAVRNLVGLNNAGTPTSQYDLSATLVTLRNPTTGVTRTVAATTTVTNNIAAATTTNGRDQAAAFTASSWVYFYFTGTGSGSATTLSSASATGPTLLTGQTEWALGGAVYNNATPRLVATRMMGAWMFYEAQQATSALAAGTTEQTVSLTTLIPPAALSLMLDVEGVITGGQAFRIRYLTGTDFVKTPGANGHVGTVHLPNISQQVFFKSDTDPGANVPLLFVTGYRVPNGDS